VTLRTRVFNNTDLNAVCELWNAHHRDLLVGIPINPERMELFVQAKTFFDQQQILLALRDDRPVGFIHLGPISNKSLDQAEQGQLSIAALCVHPDEEESAIAALLLEATEKQCRELGIERCFFRTALPFTSFYVGVGPGDSLAGVLAAEVKLCHWLSEAGYKPALPTTLWELNLLEFQAPADRIQMLVRRRSYVQRLIQEPMLPWWQSCVLGHAEVTAFHLTDRTATRTLQEVIMWSISPSLRTHPEAVVWLWPPTMEYSPEDAPVEIAPSDRLLFLLAESLRELQSEQIDAVRTVTHAESNEFHRVLTRLGFRAMESGMVFERVFK
jgi:GNAT superfamily N-acetyltransferase